MVGSMLVHLLCHVSRYGSLGGRHATLRQLASAAPASPLVQQYAALVSSGSLLHDASQEAAVQALATLQQHMLAPRPLNLTNQQEMLRPPRGVVLHGPVGSGKTVLMDLFYSTLQLPAAGSALFTDHAAASQQSVASTLSNPPATTASAGAATSPSTSTTSAPPPQLQPRPSPLKRRLHFHEFMLAVHQRLHALQTSRPKQVARSRLGLPVYRYADSQDDPLDRVVMEVAADTQVLCLDELHVTDVADAMILSRLLEGILYHGTFFVFTSNRHPKDLYKNGLSRKYFEPFIETIEATMLVKRVDSGRDFRTNSVEERSGNGSGGALFMGPGGQQALEESWSKATKGWQQPQAQQLHVAYGRSLLLSRLAVKPASTPAAGATVSTTMAAFFTFEQLCGGQDLGGALGPSDFLALCKQVPLIFLQGVPRFTPANKDEARRFVNFLDTLYEQRCKLLVSAACPPSELLLALLADAARHGVNPNLGKSKADRLSVPKLLQEGPPAPTGRETSQKEVSLPLLQEEVLMYHRAASRLTELCPVRHLSTQTHCTALRGLHS